MLAPLDYASDAAEHGIGYHRTADGATITVPSPRSRRIEAAIGGTIAVFANELGLLLLAGGIFAWFVGERWTCPALSSLLAITFTIAWFYFRKLSDPMIVEVTPTAVVFQNLSHETPIHSFPRDKIYDVKYVNHSKNLVIRARGLEILEWRPVPDERELTRMALFLREAIGLDHRAPDAAPPSP